MTSSLRRPLSLSQLSSPPFGTSTRRASPTRGAGKATPLSGEGDEDGASFFSVSTVSKSTWSPDMQGLGHGGAGRYLPVLGSVGWMFFPIRRSCSISFTRAQGFPKYKVGFFTRNASGLHEDSAACLCAHFADVVDVAWTPHRRQSMGERGVNRSPGHVSPAAGHRASRLWGSATRGRSRSMDGSSPGPGRLLARVMEMDARRCRRGSKPVSSPAAVSFAPPATLEASAAALRR